MEGTVSVTRHEENRAGVVTLMRDLVKALVDDSESVVIRSHHEEGFVVMDVKVNPKDVGQVIGKQGRTARSLRTILSAIRSKTGVRYDLNIHPDAAHEGKGTI